MKTYNYIELKGIIKVGMKVKAVEGMNNDCNELIDGKIGTITQVDDDGFCINGCYHPYNEHCHLQIIEEEKTWDNLCQGDILTHGGNEYEVLGICGRAIFTSDFNNFSKADRYAYTKEELIKDGFKIKGASEDKPSIDDVIEILDKAHYHACDSDVQEAIMPAIEMLKKLK